MDYQAFLETKIDIAPESGFDISDAQIHPALKPHQRDSVRWALRGGRRALFQSFGLGKTIEQLEWCRLVAQHTNGHALIILPLGVKQEFARDAVQLLGFPEPPPYVRSAAEAEAAKTAGHRIMMTNYERVRDGDINPQDFDGVSLDEASVLRSYGSKTYQEFMPKMKGIRYKLVCTATPSPNRYKELIHYAGYLEIMDTGQALTRFFKRDSTKANNLTLYEARETEFWLWMSSWALFLTSPKDIGHDATGYDLPPLVVNWHTVSVEDLPQSIDRDGQVRMVRNAALGAIDAMREKRDSIHARIALAKQIVDQSPDDHFILWHDLEDERRGIKAAIPEAVEIYGSQDLEIREARTIGFSEGEFRILATKKELSGSGCNFQRHCHRAIFVGIDYEFNDFIQAIHRIYRFLQTREVIIDIITTDSEHAIADTLREKWANHDHMVSQMIGIIEKHGLSGERAMEKLRRSMGVERVEVKGTHYMAINNDCVEETAKMADDSVGLIVTSIPFGNHYEYSPNYNDFGHNPDTERFMAQMDYLSPELLRVLQPGRVFCCHVKDRVLFGNATGTGMPTMEPFHALCIQHYMRHGFQYFGMITILTDVVRENNQTYRLGWSEQCKDGTKMGVGCPEYILLFRKLPTDTTKAYADNPVSKGKADYTRAQWQIDAHGFWRSSGDRLIGRDELDHVPVSKLQRVYREFSRGTFYNYEDHVKFAQSLDIDRKLPASFMVCGAGSWSDQVWDDINRMRTHNTTQKRRNQEMHVCLARGSLVLTRDGYKPIENIAIGDLVLSHLGNWKPVMAKACTGENGVVRTKAQGVPNLITTPDHKLWARITDKARAKDYMRKTAPNWVEAQDLQGGWINLKLPPIEDSELTPLDWWIVGRYLADGHVGTRGDFFISVGKDKQDAFERMAGEYAGAYAERAALQYRLKNLPENLSGMLRKCGRGAGNKQVPIEGICLNAQKANELLEGYLSGDGNRTGNAVSACSVSRALLLGMAMVAQRATGIIASVFAGKPAGQHNIEGREVNQQQLWVMGWRNSSHHHHGELMDDGAWKKVKSVSDCGQAETWSIQVADDASYTAEGCIVKNCPLQLDIVERLINRYSNRGDVVYDPFAGIFTVPERAVRAGRYGMGCELSSGYFRDGVGYLQAAENDAAMPTMFDLIDAMA